MRRLRPLLLVLLLPLAATAKDTLLGTLTSSGASVSQTVPAGVPLAIQCDAPAYYLVGTGSVTATAALGTYVAGNQWWPLGPADAKVTVVAAISASGTANCKLWALPQVLP